MMPPHSGDRLRVSVVRLPANFDAATASMMAIQLRTSLSEGTAHFVFDMSAVTACDNSALDLLERFQSDVSQRQGSLRLVKPKDEEARRCLGIAAGTVVFAFYPSVTAAVVALRGER